MQKNIAVTACILFLASIVFAPFATNAALWSPKTDEQKNLTNTFATGAGFELKRDSPLALVGTLIQTFLGLLGILFLALIIYGGFRWMNAQGAEEDVTKAKNIITQAVIGLVIIMAAYAISTFVVGRIQEKTLKTTDSLSTHFV